MAAILPLHPSVLSAARMAELGAAGWGIAPDQSYLFFRGRAEGGQVSVRIVHPAELSEEVIQHLAREHAGVAMDTGILIFVQTPAADAPLPAPLDLEAARAHRAALALPGADRATPPERGG